MKAPPSHVLRARALALAALLAILPQNALAEEGEEAPTVGAIRWEGVHALGERELEAAMLTSEARWEPWRRDRPFSESELRADLERVESLYRRHGYYRAAATYTLEWKEDRSRVTVRMTVEEGEPVRLDAARITFAEEAGLEPELREALREAAGLEIGTPFGAERYAAARRRLLEALAARGRPAARLEGGAEIRLVVNAARVDWRVEPGPEVRFGPPVFRGLEKVEPAVLRRELTFAPGGRYSPEALESSRDALLELGLFRTVALEPRRPGAEAEEGPPEGGVEPAPEARSPRAPDAPEPAGGEGPPVETWPVEVRVEERPLRTVRAGVGFGTDDLLRGQVSWRSRNFFGNARSLEISAKASALVLGVEAHFQQPHVFERDLSFELDAAVRRDTLPAYDANIAETGFLFRRPLGEHWSVRVGHGFEFVNVTDASDEAEEELEDPPDDARLSFLRLGLRRVALDDRVDPRRGTWLDVSLEPSSGAIGSQVDYLKAVAELRGYAPLPFWESVVAARLEAGTLEPYGGDGPEDVPVVKRFYSGGSTSVRGFSLQGLGPLDDDDDPLGGLSLLEASLEWRVPVWGPLGAVLFSDAGQLSLEPSAFDGKVFVSAGAGLRYATPLGPVRLDLAHVLNPDDGTSPFRVHVSVGHAF